jgi:hypothetical protein
MVQRYPKRPKGSAKRKLKPLKSYPPSQRETIKRFRAMSLDEKRAALKAVGYPLPY